MREGDLQSVEELSGDITDRETLLESEAFHRHLINALPMAIYTCDGQGRVMMYNQAAASLWGRESEIGKDLWCGSRKMYRPHGGPFPLDGCAMALPLRASRPAPSPENI